VDKVKDTQLWADKLAALLEDKAAIAKGLDIHTAMAAWYLGKDAKDVTPDERNYAKSRSFVYLYATPMGGTSWKNNR